MKHPRLSIFQTIARRMACTSLALAVALTALAPASASAATPLSDVAKQFGGERYNELVDWPMVNDPRLPNSRSQIVFNPRLMPILIAAFARPDVETRRHAIDAMGEAYVRGLKEAKSVAPEMVAKLADPKLHPVERLSIIATLTKFEYVEAGPQFAKLNQSLDADVIQVTDKPLAAWKTAGMDATWLERISNPRTPRAIRVSAMEAAGTAKVSSTASALLGVALDRTGDESFRLAAARAVGLVKEEGLEQSALELLDAAMPAPTKLDRVLGVTLLRHHKGRKAEAILLRMASDPEPAVATIAAERLVEVDPLLLTPVSVKLSKNDDVGVRAQAARSLAAQKTPAAIAALCPLLNDPAPEVRAYVRDQLILLDAEKGLSDPVRNGVTAILAGEDWRGLECASLILGKLDHKPAVDRLMAIKENPRNEVRLAAVTAIRWLAIPETLPLLAAYVDDLSSDAPSLVTKAGAAGKEGTDALARLRLVTARDPEISQIMQFFGTAKYHEAEPMMKKFIPKKSMPFNSSRAAAIWSLGQLHLDDANEELGGAFLSRYNDTHDIMNPESGEVRHMSVIAMGFMNYRKLVNSVMVYLKEDNNSTIAAAGRWAIKRVSGREMPEPPITDDVQTGWFIEPRQVPKEKAAPPAAQ